MVIDEYNEIDEVSDIAGTYYTLADGRILREFYGPSGALAYTIVDSIPNEKVGGAIESGEKFFSWMSTAADFIPGVSNGKGVFEGFFGVDPFTGDKLSGWEQGVAGAAIIGGPLVKLGKGAVKVGGEAVGKIKNVLHPDKVKDIAKKAYEDYIKSPLQKGYTYFKEYKKKLSDIEYSSIGELVLEGVGAADSKTWGDLANDVKSKAVYMFKKLDEKIGGKGNTKPLQNHHYATNKSKKYTPKIEEITKKYDLELDDDWNKELLPHQGRHPNAYHEYVLERLRTFDKVAKGDREKFLKLYEQLKQKVRENPDMLYKDYWRKQ